MGSSQEISWKQEGDFLIIKKNFKMPVVEVRCQDAKLN